MTTTVTNTNITFEDYTTQSTAETAAVGLSFLSTQTLSSVATADFTLASGYDSYEILINNLSPVNDAVDLYVRTSTDGGSTYAASASNYSYTLFEVDNSLASRTPYVSTGATFIKIINSQGSATDESISGILYLTGANQVNKFHLTFEGSSVNTSGVIQTVFANGVRETAADVDAIRFLFSSGNISSGTIKLYGRKNA